MAVRKLPVYRDTPKFPIITVPDLLVKLQRYCAAGQVDGTYPPVVFFDTETYHNILNSRAVVRTIHKAKNNEPFLATVGTLNDGEEWCVIADLPQLQAIFDIPGVIVCGHNIKYDVLMMGNIGVNIICPLFCTMNFIHLIDEEFECNMPTGKKRPSKSLKDLAYHFLGDDAHELEDLVSETRRVIAATEKRPLPTVSYKDVFDVNPALMIDYATYDIVATRGVFKAEWPEMQKQELFPAYEVDRQATIAVLDQERRGILVNKPLLAQYHSQLAQLQVDILTDICNEMDNPELEISSSPQLIAALELHLGIQWQWRTDKGEYSSDDAVMELVAKRYPESAGLIANIQDYRSVSKLLSTYIIGLEEVINPDGRVHASYNICPFESRGSTSGGTKTGRLSSNDPNLQNIPKRTLKVRGMEFNIRNLFIADDGYVMVFMDFDQEEYRLLAHYAKDAAFMKLIHDGKDVHKGTAEMMFGVPYDEVTKELRDDGKTINFALVYGLGNAELAKKLGYDIDTTKYKEAGWIVSRLGYKPWDLPASAAPVLVKLTSERERDLVSYYFSEEVRSAIDAAAEAKKKYFAQFPDIAQFLKDCKNVAEQRGYIKLWTGRRRHLKYPKRDGYKAPNSLIQGGCGEIIKTKMYEIYTFLQGKKSFVFNNVHDELGIMVHKDELGTIAEMNRIISDLPQFRVPISAGIEWAFSWGDKHDFESVDKLEGEVRKRYENQPTCVD